MGFKIKNSLTGEFEKLPILTLKGEKGETGGVEEYNKVDYMGNKYETLKQANDANVEYAIKTAIGEFNYLDYEGQHITATNSIEGHAKSAILSGQTLVNLVENEKAYAAGNGSSAYRKVTKNSNSTKIEIVGTEVSCVVVFDNNYQLKANTKYTITFDSSTTGFEDKMVIGFHSNKGSYAVATKSVTTNNGKNKIVLSTPSEFGIVGIAIGRHGAIPVGSTIQISNMIVLEGEYTNQDIPYFEGMQSVKMPVLQTTGKNLFFCENYDSIIDGDNWVSYKSSMSNGSYVLRSIKYTANRQSAVSILTGRHYPFGHIDTSDNIGLIPSNVLLLKDTPYTFSCKLSMINSDGQNHNYAILFVDALGNVVKRTNNINVSQPNYSYTFTPTSNIHDIRIYIVYGTTWEFELKLQDIQIEIGSTATSYEPYKTNILSTPEDLELRAIGDVKDELNLLTGELTQRIGEIVLDSSNVESWRTYEAKGEYSVGKLSLPLKALGNGGAIPSTNVKCDKINVGTTNQEGSQEQISIYYHSVNGNYCELRLCLLTSKLTSADIEGIRTYVQNNPFVVQYQLAEKSIKTVDLSDNVVYSYDNITHYSCSSEEGSLVPTLSVKVPTDVQATIAQQRETIQTLNSENERLNQIQEALKASMLDSQVQLMNLSWDTDFEVFTLRESIAPKDFLLASRTGSNIDKFSQAKFIIENDCPDLEKLNSQIEYYFSKNIFSQEQFEELTDLISIVKGENGCEY